MWTGAIRGFATLKFSTSPSKFGLKEIIIIIPTMIRIIGIESFTKNKGLNFTLSVLNLVAVGLVEPFSCRKIR